MSHTPPAPEAAPVPAAAAAAAPTLPQHDATPTDSTTRRVIAGAAVGIGSAAIVAALLYTNRKSADAQRAAARDHARHPEPAD